MQVRELFLAGGVPEVYGVCFLAGWIGPFVGKYVHRIGRRCVLGVGVHQEPLDKLRLTHSGVSEENDLDLSRHVIIIRLQRTVGLGGNGKTILVHLSGWWITIYNYNGEP